MESLVPYMYRQIFQRFRCPQKSFYTNGYVPRISMNGPRWHHGSLLLDNLKNRIRTYPHRCQFILVHLHINHLLLNSQKLHPLDIRHTKKPLPYIFCILSLFFIGVIVPGHCINGAIHIVKPVIDVRSHYPGRKLTPHILYRVANLGPMFLKL